MERKRIPIKNKKNIYINQNYIPSIETYNGINLNERETWFKNAFIKILKDNCDNTVIKLVDLKAKYFGMLPLQLQKDKSLVQILKNLIGSNKDNKTNFIRDPHVDWYYCDGSKKDYIYGCEKYRKPVQLPKQLERSRTKKYYAFYTSILDGSASTTSIEAELDSATVVEKSYDDILFETIKEKKTDYVEKQKRAQELGDIGEKYVFKLEEERMKENGIDKKPIWVSKKNDSYGFDILSFRKKADGTVYRVYIEVKTTNGSLYNKFFVSQLELEISKKIQNAFLLVRVYNAGDEGEINHKEFFGDLSKNKQLKMLKQQSIISFQVAK